MDSTSMPHKLLKVEESVKTEESLDRISSFPDSVLCHILSFLPTKYAVGTSILSSRWRYLFASIPSLDFDDSLLLHPQEENEITTFMNFVDRMFILRDITHVDRLRLKSGKDVDGSRVNAWICAALRRNVRELDLHVSMRTMKEFDRLPHNLFTCMTLVVLKLGAYKFVLKVPLKVWLPNLKVIQLDDLEFHVDDSIQRLTSGCPVLEELVIFGCSCVNICIFNIFAPSLKSLTIDCLAENEGGFMLNAQNLVLYAPNLVYLKYNDIVPEVFSANNLESLAIAHIDVGFDFQGKQDVNHKHGESTTAILRAISEIQFLHFSGDFMEAIGLSFDRLELPTFSNLTCLELGCHDYVGWKMLPDLLERSPLLETLVFQEGLLLNEYKNKCQWDPPQHVPYCLIFHLKTIEIENFKGFNDEMKIVEYFLNNASVLEKMKIRTDQRSHNKVSKKFSKLPMVSRTCEVAISLY